MALKYLSRKWRRILGMRSSISPWHNPFSPYFRNSWQEIVSDNLSRKSCWCQTTNLPPHNPVSKDSLRNIASMERPSWSERKFSTHIHTLRSVARMNECVQARLSAKTRYQISKSPPTPWNRIAQECELQQELMGKMQTCTLQRIFYVYFFSEERMEYYELFLFLPHSCNY